MWDFRSTGTTGSRGQAVQKAGEAHKMENGSEQHTAEAQAKAFYKSHVFSAKLAPSGLQKASAAD